MQFDPRNWFWIVAGDAAQVWSSAVSAYVPAGNDVYAAWLASGGKPSCQDSEETLTEYLQSQGLRGPVASVDDVIAERVRRLALGFDFAFGDDRGTHHVGTSPSDMIGWDEVSKLAGALVALGDNSTKITIVTDTGPAEVTALEWQAILVAAAQFRQPIWAASFALQAMNPIPRDYAAHGYWNVAT
jgi:hypothetical protein